MGKIASNYTKSRLAGKYIDLEFEGKRRGHYGRLLAYVFVDGKNFNIALVRQGLSPYYTKYGSSRKYDQEFSDAERYARKHGLNIWGDPCLAKKYLRLKSKWGQKKDRITAVPITIPIQGQSCVFSHASYLARLTKSVNPGFSPETSPVLACLYNAYRRNSISLAGLSGSVFTSWTALSNVSFRSDISSSFIEKLCQFGQIKLY